MDKLINAAPLQLSEETEFLIKAAIAENTQKAYQRATRLRDVVSRSNTIRCTLSELPHRLTRNR